MPRLRRHFGGLDYIAGIGQLGVLLDFHNLSALSAGDRRSYQEKVERFSKTKFGNAYQIPA